MHQDLSNLLETTYLKFHRSEYLVSDPLEFPHQFSDRRDQEAVALISALLAYGNVGQIRRSIQNLLRLMLTHADSPRSFVMELRLPQFRRRARRGLESFVHRFNRGEDVFHLFDLLSESWETYGSLGAEFNSYFLTEDVTIENALAHLVDQWKRKKRGAPSSLNFLLNSPRDGSACKRWCMFLRWMVRKDELDLGLWSGARLKPSHLVMPLDTHTGRISKALGLTIRKSSDWKAALEVTQNLKTLDPHDPVRFDFALCRVGMLEKPGRPPLAKRAKA